jgi:hypothetical protein
MRTGRKKEDEDWEEKGRLGSGGKRKMRIGSKKEDED